MKHPIYRDNTVRTLMRSFKNVGYEKFLEYITPIFKSMRELGTKKHAQAYADKVKQYVGVESCGAQLIQLTQADAWNETLSKKTLQKMSVDDIKLPYNAFMIDIRDASWTKFDYVGVSYEREGILLVLEEKTQEGEVHRGVHIKLGENLGEEIELVLDTVAPKILKDFEHLLDADFTSSDKYLEREQLEDTLYKIITIIMYVVMFQKVTDKVKIVKFANKGSKKRGIPDHETAVTYLTQPTYKLLGKEKSGKRGSSDKTWLQRGHFRRQPHGKRDAPQYKSIWIDAMWKGSGSKQLERVIKV